MEQTPMPDGHAVGRPGVDAATADVSLLRGALLLCAAWGLVGTLSYARHHLQDPGAAFGRGLLPAYLMALTCFVPWIPLSAVVFRLERRFPLGRADSLAHLLALAALSVPVVLAASWLTTAAAAGVRALFDLDPAAVPPLWPVPPRELLGHQFLYWPVVIVSWMLRAVLEARDSERRAARLTLETARLQTSLRQAELDALRMRLQPHFLFNSLQNISVLTEHDPPTASRMLTRLGDLLRASLRGDGRPESTLQAEVELTRSYLAVEQMRFGGRLSAHVNLGPGTERALVPSFLLQPLVENAIRHGLEGLGGRGVIAINSRVEGDALVITVADNGVGPSAAPVTGRGAGIGLGATGERLARMYPGRHSLSMRPLPEGGTEVRVELPVSIAAAEAPYANAAPADR